MKRGIEILMVLLLVCSTHAEERVVFANAKASFILPSGFARMAPDMKEHA